MGKEYRCWEGIARKTKLRLPLLGALLAVAASSGAAAQEPIPHVPGQIVLQPKAGTSEQVLSRLFGQIGAREEGRIPQINLRIVRVPDQRQQTVLDALRHNPNIQFADPDYLLEPTVTPNDPYYSQEYHLTKIAASSAWNYSVGSASVTIAILDSGIDSTHPDLASLIVPGWNFYDNNADLTDVTGHGTSVAGVAAALGNNGAGVAAVTWGCRLMPLRIASTTGSASSSACASALSWAADHGARVANISYGNVTKITAINTAAQYFQSKGGVVTASAGNSGTFDSTAENPLFLLVSATDQNDVLATWSCTGNNVDLAAPGVNVVTTANGGGYASGSGTSYSAPIVAGVAALVISANPSLSATQVQDILKNNADDLGPAGWDSSYGSGRVNAAKALAAATGSSIPPADTTAPTVSITSPSAAAIVSGTVSVSVSGSDNVGVTKVEWYLDGALKSSVAAASGSFAWDTTSSANGNHTLTAKAYDAAGNVGTSASVTVSVSNPVPDTTAPLASVSAPLTGATVSGAVAVSVSGSDNVGVTKVEWYLDGTLKSSSATASASFSWDSTAAANGSHTVSAKAYDAAGNVGTSTGVTVNVSNPVPDTTAPSVSVSAPLSGATVAGVISVLVSGSDNVGVTKVEWYLDGTLKSSSATASASFSWDTTAAANGSHTVSAKAYDAAGNVGTSTGVTVNVSNPVPDTTAPSVSVSAPLSGATVAGAISVSVSGSDNVGVTKVEWYLDGTLKSSSATASASFSWDTTVAANGSHTVSAKAYDAAGNVGTSAAVTVMVNNVAPDTTAPTVQITSPATGTKVSKTVKINVSASDNVGVSRIDLYIDGALYQSATSAPASFSWGTSRVVPGSHTLQAFAYDAAGNKGSSAIVTVSK